jgi:predicted acyl esterase
MNLRFFHTILLSCLFSFFLHANSQPEPSVTVHIPMRDGKELTTDLFYPPGSCITNEYPCLLIRLPGGRKAEPWVHLSALAKAGYVVAIQDTRSALDKEGKTMPYFSDGWDVEQDGYDTIAWLASSSFTNGKIGTLGYSAAGITQLLLAPTAPKALKCQYIGQAPASLYHHAIYPGGRLLKNQVEVWFSHYAPHPSVLEVVKSNPKYNDLWKKVDPFQVSHLVEAPAIHFGGWFDPFIQGTIDEFTARQQEGGEGAKGNQKLLIGPWHHFWPHNLVLGGFQLPKNAEQPPIDLSEKRWFDYYLKGIDNGINKVPPVTYYVMGPFDGTSSGGNTWRHAEKWPIAAIETPFYLTSEKKLSEKKDLRANSFTYIHDPENHVPTIGGRNIFLEFGPLDQRPIESRKDVLVFTTPPLTEEVEVTGRILAKLFFTANAPEIDFAVRLTDVYPDGKSLLIAEGFSHVKTSENEKGTQLDTTVDLFSTSLVFAKGHSIRISIAGSNYPRHEKNAYKISQNENSCCLLVGKNTASYLLLPIVKKG